MQGYPLGLRIPLAGVCAAFLLWFCAGNLRAEDPSPLHIPRVTRAPRLEDFIQNRPREAEVAISVFTQFDPHDGQPATQPTTAYLSYDAHNLYVGWVCKDDPKLIRARVAPRKAIDTDDRVTINIDTFQDRKHAYWFDVNPYGIQYDGRTTDGIGDDPSWEGLWYSEGRIVNDGYVVLQAIPFRTLRFPRGSRQVWNIVLGRFIQRSNEMSLWPAVNHAHLPAFVGQYAPIELDDNITPSRNVQLIPYGLVSNDHYLDPALGWQQEDEYKPGLDAKMVLDGAFTLDFTANPDFSEIGSDDPKVTANQRYTVIFPERRPFFLENSSAFSTPEFLFFSRQIVDPQFGLKLTGTHGPWGAGALVADDRAPGKIALPGQPGHGERAYNAVARMEREVDHAGSHVGAFLSERDFNGDFNRVASIDTRILLPHNWSTKAQATTSQNQSNGVYQAGPGYFYTLKKNDNHTSFGLWYTDRSPGLNPLLGYLDRTDIRSYENYTAYEWKPAHSRLLAFGPGMDTQVIYDHEHTLQNWYLGPSFNFQLAGMTSIGVSHSEAYERYENTGLRENLSSLSFSSQWFKWMDLSSRYAWGTQANYDAPSIMKPFTGDYNYGATTLTLYPSTHLRMDGIYYYTRLASAETAHAAGAPTSVIYTNHLIRSKINYQFTRDYSFHAILDYNAMLPNEPLITDSFAKNADTTLLFTYMPHPGTAVYMGYSTNYENAEWDANAVSPYQRINDPTTQTDRQFFFKVSYLLHF
jgi:hypothetical protein